MIRLLVLMALALALAYAATRGLARLRGNLKQLVHEEPAAERWKLGSELVACPACGVHVPRARAFETPGEAGAATGPSAARFYCSESCWRRRRPTPVADRPVSA